MAKSIHLTGDTVSVILSLSHCEPFEENQVGIIDQEEKNTKEDFGVFKVYAPSLACAYTSFLNLVTMLN